MAKVTIPFGAVGGLDYDGKRYLADRKTGLMEVPDHAVNDLVKLSGCMVPSHRPQGVDGFVCVDCGFHGFFKVCGRCGGPAEKPDRATGANNE
jgi:hypothetical protein